MTNSESNNAFKIIASILILCLAGLSAYLFMGRSQQNELIANQQIEINELTGFYADLNDEFAVAKEELNSMKTDNEELNALIDAQKADLDNQRNRISRLVRENKDLGQAKVELANVRNRVSEYIKQIDALKGENKALVQSNFSLQEEKKVLISEIENERTLTANLTTAKSALTIEKEELVTERQALASKVDLASVIQTRDIQIQGFKVKDSGKLVKKSRAKAVDLLQVCFQADQNLVVSPGQETFYVRIVNPLGETMAMESLGSGTLDLSASSEMVRYTQSTQIDYANETVPMCIQWRPELPFNKGGYQVEVFNKGHRVGSSEFVLK